MTPLPKDPAGSDPLVQTIKQLIRCVKERTVIADPTITVQRTAQGTMIKVARRGTSGGGSTSGGSEPARWI